MGEKMDDGDIIDMKKIAISEIETTASLFEKFAEISGDFAAETLLKLDRGELTPQAQDENKATYCKKISKEEGLIDFTKSAKKLYHLYQGFTPWPGAYTTFKGKKLIIEKCFFSPRSLGEGLGVRAIGTVIQMEDKTIGIICGK